MHHDSHNRHDSHESHNSHHHYAGNSTIENVWMDGWMDGWMQYFCIFLNYVNNLDSRKPDDSVCRNRLSL